MTDVLVQPQWAMAKARADEVRSKRAVLKKQIATGQTTVALVLSDTPEWAECMKVSQLLMAVRGQGPTKVMHFLRYANISPHRHLRDLTTNQVLAITRWLG